MTSVVSNRELTNISNMDSQSVRIYMFAHETQEINKFNPSSSEQHISRRERHKHRRQVRYESNLSLSHTTYLTFMKNNNREVDEKRRKDQST